MATVKCGQKSTSMQAMTYLAEAEASQLNPMYEFGTDLIDETQIRITSEQIELPGYAQPIALGNNEGFEF